MAMDLALYQHIRKHFLAESVDLFDSGTQAKIEAYDASIGLDTDILASVKKYLKAYNDYLKSIKAAEVTLRYYQILAIYFTEAYFLNRTSKAFADAEFSLNALAYWMATGSGKTLIMHLNIFQFIAHTKTFKELELIITTPGVNLIQQHEREMTPLVEYLNKLHKNKINVLIDTTSALLNKADDFFDFPDDAKYQRLILVDEAHIGLGNKSENSDGAFLDLRKRLNIKHSFLFEYSATFHNLSNNLEAEYSKSIVYDYNYNLFYRDGYGKDFYFQKIDHDVLQHGSIEDNLTLNLKVIEEKLQIFAGYNYAIVKDLFSATSFPDKPLIAFMGNTVNDKKDEGKNDKDELSDISKILDYLAGLSIEQRSKLAHVFNHAYQGNLKLTRNSLADDEILLSYGDGDYWGIVNVGNGLNFINAYEGQNVGKITSNAMVISNIEKYLFKNIDDAKSPINVLIGSRKFAEGWNCFRVSVIGLINLGSSKGNKIIQIFGRGVRLKGLNNDGKRKDLNYVEDYFALNDADNDKLKKLETLCVFSLKSSYLETFTNAVTSELEITKSIEIPVQPSLFNFHGTQVDFETYKHDLKIFKLAKTSVDVKRVVLHPASQKLEYEYVLDGISQRAEINAFNFNLDYRTNKDTDGINIRNSIAQANKEYASFISTQSFAETLLNACGDANMQLISLDNKPTNIHDVLAYIGEIHYKSEIDPLEIEFVENVNALITDEFVRKVRNKINWHLNSSIYEYGQPLQQSLAGYKSDFIDKYTLVKSFQLSKTVGKTSKQKTEAELNKEYADFEAEKVNLQTALTVSTIEQHIYEPLMHDNRTLLNDSLKLSPDKLNDGERKFVRDFTYYVKNNLQVFADYQVYLMRNVESLKSIGLYLNDDTEVYYPDFILWLIGKDKVHISFIDPKGQMGTKDFATDQDKEKVRIADKVNNPTLTNIEAQLKAKHGKEFYLNSFILLRDSSELGTKASQDALWKKQNMLNKHILRLDWHAHDEKGSNADQTKLVDGKSYLDWIMEMMI